MSDDGPLLTDNTAAVFSEMERERDEAIEQRDYWKKQLLTEQADYDKARKERDALREALRKLAELTEGCWDEGPLGEGWPSDELVQARLEAKEALAGLEEA